MSSKQTQINKFTDGINTDLHPLTAPDNLLSDCVNGTVITYNGNEYILQNDMGNFKLENAKLPLNHIPIGIKEYGGIIYIVSYNPVDNLTEVGCYPSPKTLSEADQDPVSLSEGFIELSEEISNYTSLANKSVLTLYSAEEDFILNPGDKYYIHFDTDNDKLYQTLEFYVLGEDKTLYKLSDDEIKLHKEALTDDSELDTVSWETPGHLAFKFRIASLDSFNLIVSDVKAPSFIGKEPQPITFSLRGQIITSDILYSNPQLQNKLYIWVTAGEFIGNKKVYNTIKSLEEALQTIPEGQVDDGTTTEPVSPGLYEEFILNRDGQDVTGNLIPIKTIDYNNINQFLYSNKITSTDGSCLQLSTGQNNKFFIEAIPIIVNAAQGKHIIYDNLTTTTTLNIGSLGDANNLSAFSYYKYYVDEGEITLNFDILSPVSNLEGVETSLKIYSPVFVESTLNLGTPVYSVNLPNISYSGQNLITVPFIGNFEKENIYLLELSIKWGKEENKKVWYKTLVTSEAMNTFYNSISDFSTIYFDEILNAASTFSSWSLPTLTKKTTENTLYTNPATEDIYKFSLDEEKQQQYPVKHAPSEIIDERDYPAGGIQSVDTYSIENNTFSILGGQGIWKNATATPTLSLLDIEGKTLANSEGEEIKIIFEGYNQLPIVTEDHSLYEYKRIYLYDYTWLCSHSKRQKQIKYNLTGNDEGSVQPYWYRMRYRSEPNYGSSSAENIFRPGIQAKQGFASGKYVSIDNWSEYRSQAAKAIKENWVDNENSPSAFKDSYQYTTNLGGTSENPKIWINSSSSAFREEMAVSTLSGESLQIASIEIPWLTKSKHFSAQNEYITFEEGPFFAAFEDTGNTSSPRWRGPSFYAGFAWLYLAATGEYVWDANDLNKNTIPYNAYIWKKGAGLGNSFGNFSYYSSPNYNIWLKIKADENLPITPSPDPLLIWNKGKGTDSGDITNYYPAYLRTSAIGMGEFLPLYSVSPAYSETDFPSITDSSASPTWIRSIWGIRMLAKHDGTWKWVMLPLKEYPGDPSTKLWIDNSEGTLNKVDYDIAPNADTVVPRADLEGDKLAQYKQAKEAGFSDLTQVPGWKNDGQSFNYLQNIFERATTLATHLYTIEGENAISSIWKLSNALDPVLVENAKVSVSNIDQSVILYSSAFNIWGENTADSIVVEGQFVSLNNIISKKPAMTFNNTSSYSQTFISETNEWTINNGTDSILTYREVLNKVSNMKNIVNKNYSVVLSEGAMQRVEGVVYHDLEECNYGKDQDKLLEYFDYIVRNQVFRFDPSLHRFYIDSSGAKDGMGEVCAINGRATWLFGKTLTDYEAAYTRSTKTVGYLTPRLGLPPKTELLSLSPNFFNKND